MKNITKFNIYLGWTLIVGITLLQIALTKAVIDMGGMAIFIALFTAVLFFPFLITAIVSVLDRKRHEIKIRNGIFIGLFFHVGLPLSLPVFFDKEFIYLSLFGLFLGGLMFYFRKKREIQLVILNGIGAILWVFVSLVALMSE